jgi:hypothetical protein
MLPVEGRGGPVSTGYLRDITARSTNLLAEIPPG